MCGRFVSREQAAIEREFHIKVRHPFERVYNAAPSMSLPVIRRRREDKSEARSEGGLEAVGMRWGLIPSWWSQPALPSATINARSEEAAAKPMWRSAVRHARCLIPALGWYEWRSEATGKVPYFIHAAPVSRGVCFAGLWSEWKGSSDGATSDAAMLSFAILTRAASPALTPVHNRMPVVLAAETWADWLAEWPSDHAARLAGFAAGGESDFDYYPVSRYVNAPANQGERCVLRSPPIPES